MIFTLPKKNNRVFVVGADSYLGGHFVKYWLENGCEVHGCGEQHLANELLKQIKYSVTDYLTWHLPVTDYDWIIICLDPAQNSKKYLGSIQGLCNYIESNKITAPICYPSSYMICETNSKRAISENVRITPHSEYEMNIAAAELYLTMRSYRTDGLLLSYILRMGELYGQEITFGYIVATPGLINEYWKNAMAGNSLDMYGLGLKKRTVTHIADACRFAIKYMNLDFAPRIINVPGERMQVVDFLMAIASHYNVNTSLVSPAQNNIFCNRFSGNQVLSDKLAKALVKYEHRYTFKRWLMQQPTSHAGATMA